MQDVELFVPEPQHTAELGCICYEAFRHVFERHGFAYDVPNAETAIKIIGLIQSLPDSFRIAARVEGRLAGSNFMIMSGGVAGLGPITVDPACHGRGIGRLLMQAVLDYAARNGIKQVRLMQDAFNNSSLSLYASVGFDVREPVALMQAGRSAVQDPAVRGAQAGDIAALEELCVRHYKVNRRNELAGWMERGFTVLVHERQGRIQGYLMPGKIGHGVAETEAVALALITQITHHVAPGLDFFFCPLRNTSLYRAALKSGCRLKNVKTLMTLGPYEESASVWMPSIAF